MSWFQHIFWDPMESMPHRVRAVLMAQRALTQYKAGGFNVLYIVLIWWHHHLRYDEWIQFSPISFAFNNSETKSFFRSNMRFLMNSQGRGDSGEERLPEMTRYEEADSEEIWVMPDGGIINHYSIQYTVCYIVYSILCVRVRRFWRQSFFLLDLQYQSEMIHKILSGGRMWIHGVCDFSIRRFMKPLFFVLSFKFAVHFSFPFAVTELFRSPSVSLHFFHSWHQAEWQDLISFALSTEHLRLQHFALTLSQYIARKKVLILIEFCVQAPLETCWIFIIKPNKHYHCWNK